MSELMDNFILEFEKPVRFLENQIKELKQAGSTKTGLDISKEVEGLQQKVNELIEDIYENLSPWERVQLSRHPARPHSKDYLEYIIDDFHELAGDRRFANDHAIISGFGYLDGQKVCVVAIEKGRKTKEKMIHNFGMPRPEGYRKALRVMGLASRFNVPIITFVDTPGAYPGIGAEERGQAQAIAENLMEMFELRVPIISLVIGEGGSGGALGVAIADHIAMMEYSVYSVISPESCASILWSDPKKAEDAANALKLGPSNALELGIIDSIIDEPAGGAHRSYERTFDLVKKALKKEVVELSKIDVDKLLEKRYQRFRSMGNHTLSGEVN